MALAVVAVAVVAVAVVAVEIEPVAAVAKVTILAKTLEMINRQIGPTVDLVVEDANLPAAEEVVILGVTKDQIGSTVEILPILS